MKSPIIEFKVVSKNYLLNDQHINALININLSIFRSEFIALVGPSGSGKTTFLNLLSLIDLPTVGEVIYNKLNTSKLNDNKLSQIRNKQIGIILQNYNLIPILNIIENVAFPLQIGGYSKKDSLEKAEIILNQLGIGGTSHKRPCQLSGGERQRAAIARALVTDPQIIIADEPTSTLDSKTGQNIINFMKEININRGTTFIFSTHDLRMINHAQRVIELLDGRIIN
jgi:putative ABC transport system ATP-binding protein